MPIDLETLYSTGIPAIGKTIEYAGMDGPPITITVQRVHHNHGDNRNMNDLVIEVAIRQRSGSTSHTTMSLGEWRNYERDRRSKVISNGYARVVVVPNR